MRNFLRTFVLLGAVAMATPLNAQTVDNDAKSVAVAAAAQSDVESRQARSVDPTNSDASSELAQLREEVAAQRASIASQISALQAQQARLENMERRLAVALGEDPVRLASDSGPASQRSNPQPVQVASAVQSQPTNAVGVAPEIEEGQPEVAALGRQGSAITSKGKLSGEVEFSYARADRNRALFRGVEVVESVLIGTFDINESRQDVLTKKFGLQYGLTSDIEIGVDVPMIARWDTSVLTPVAATSENDASREVDNSANAYGIGDVELSVRKQLHAPKGFGPYVIGSLQVTVPTGKGPFEVERNEFGEAQAAATGSGFWSVTPGLTAILPSDPGVIFGSLSYTKNFAGDVDTTIPPVMVERVDPGDALGFSAGIGLALNPRLSLNFGYGHSWGFGTETTTRALAEGAQPVVRTSRDLQVGRFLFGGTYKVNKSTSVNFGIEAGLTDDATDLRMTVRIPFVL